MKPREQIISRTYVALTLIALLPILVAARMVEIYMTDAPELRAQGQAQAIVEKAVPAVRGSIEDRSGLIMATTQVSYTLAVDPTVDGFENRQLNFAANLGEMTGNSADSYHRTIKRRTSPRYAVLETTLTEEQMQKVKTWDVPGVRLQSRIERVYNFGKTGSHVIGHVDTDLKGVAGIESHFDEALDGTDGYQTLQRDKYQRLRKMIGGDETAPEDGGNIVLTLDVHRQSIVEEEIERAMKTEDAASISVVAMDPNTGAILAMANAPTFDPNRIKAGQKDRMRNRAITDVMEPGSTFKLVASVAALEEDIVSLGQVIDTEGGKAKFAGRTMRDDHRYDELTFAEVIIKSSNVGIAKTTSKLSPGVFYQYARNMGFGIQTSIDLPGERTGLLKKPADWSRVSQPWMSTGYEVQVTPLQTLSAYAALANGGELMQPYVVAERRNASGKRLYKAKPKVLRRVMRPETARALVPVFERVVTEGTAQEAFVEKLRIAGKTGTAQKNKNGRYIDAHRASFVGFFPADDPVVAMIVVVDEPKSIYGGKAAAPIFARIAERWISTFPELAASVAPPGVIVDSGERVVPELKGLPRTAAHHQLIASGLAVIDTVKTDEPDPVMAVRPGPGSVVLSGTPVQLVATPRDAIAKQEDSTVMPNVVGLSSRQAMTLLSRRGVEFVVRGMGSVVKQLPVAGSPLTDRVTLVCESTAPRP